MQIHTRGLSENDFSQMKALILRDGPNEWNYITDESIEYQFRLMKDGKAKAILAEETEIVGFAVLIYKDSCPPKLEKYTSLEHAAYIKDVVVSRKHSGKGIGSKLLNESIRRASEIGCTEVFIERHEENLPSARMMIKAGFDEVETYFNPEKRSSGSRKTTVMVRNIT